MVPRAKVNYKRDPITAISDLINLFWLSTSNNKGLFGKKEKRKKKKLYRLRVSLTQAEETVLAFLPTPLPAPSL